MKNILYKLTFSVLIATSFASCVTVEDDFDDERPDQIELHPPAWIQGKWADTYNDQFPPMEGVTYFYKFTPNDVITRVVTAEVGYREMIESVRGTEEEMLVEEESNDSVYKLKISNEFVTFYHDFRKTSDSTFYDKAKADQPVSVGNFTYFRRYVD